jgi:hypothetical protein
MWIIGILGILLLIGLLTRKKGDGLLDTLGSGCSFVFGVIVIIIIIILLNR